MRGLNYKIDVKLTPVGGKCILKEYLINDYNSKKTLLGDETIPGKC